MILYSNSYKDWIPDEKDGSVISNQIPVSIFSIEFDRKASGISGSVCRTTLAT
jgi:hypothetical protein